jgi:hypothetical protein
LTLLLRGVLIRASSMDCLMGCELVVEGGGWKHSVDASSLI